MKDNIVYILAFLLLTVVGCSENNIENTENRPIFQKGTKIDNDNFNGTVWLTMLTESDSLNPMYAGNVHFEPSVRTNWHSHPAGQILIVVSGEGYYQELGQPKQILRKGETIKCPPNIKHWHGASPRSEFSHIAISSSHKGPAQWYQPVSDKEYAN